MDSTPIPGVSEAAAAEGCAAHYMEHRWGRRIRCGTPVRISCGAGQTGAGRMRDVSMSGAFVETSLDLPLFAPVELAVLRSHGWDIALSGHVVRRDADGVGIEWHEANPGAICPVLGCITPCETAAHWK
jgi:hypothetical protein